MGNRTVYTARVQTAVWQSEVAIQRVSWLISQLSWGAIMAAWMAFIAALYYYATTGSLGLSAFEVYFDSAKMLASGTETIYNGLRGWIYLYPPLLAQLLIPFTSIKDPLLVVNLWLGFNVGVLVVTIHVLTRYVPAGYHKLLWIAPIAFIPIWQAMYIGQITIIMLALLTGVWVAVQEDRKNLAGGLLALASWIKVFPALLVLYFIWKRDWRVVRAVIGWGLVLFGFQLTVSGADLMVAFFRVLFGLTVQGQPEATFENLSIFAFTSRLFQSNVNVMPLLVNDQLFQWSRSALTAGMLFAAFYAILRSGAKTIHPLNWRFDVEYGLVILTILLAGGTLWISGLPPVLLISVLILRHTPQFRLASLTRTIWGVAIGLIVLYQPLLVFFVLVGGAINALTLSLGFFGVALLWLLMVGLLLQRLDLRSARRTQ